jgi:uncharacterized protein (DUF697 family)
MGKLKGVTAFDFKRYNKEPDIGAFSVNEEVKVLAAAEEDQSEAFKPVPNISPENPTFDFITLAKVEEIIKNRSLLSAGIGIIPVPVVNLLSVMAIQINMVQDITRLYNVEVKKSWIKNIISSVLGGLATTGLSGVAAGSLVAVPLVGTSLAVLSAPALNGLTTYAIGYMFVRYFESPDGILKTNFKALGDWFKEGFKDGREKLGDAISGKPQAV